MYKNYLTLEIKKQKKKQSGSHGCGNERKGDIKAIAGSLEHCSFAFARKQINELYNPAPANLRRGSGTQTFLRPVMNRMYTSTKYYPLPNNCW